MEPMSAVVAVVAECSPVPIPAYPVRLFRFKSAMEGEAVPCFLPLMLVVAPAVAHVRAIAVKRQSVEIPSSLTLKQPAVVQVGIGVIFRQVQVDQVAVVVPPHTGPEQEPVLRDRAMTVARAMVFPRTGTSLEVAVAQVNGARITRPVAPPATVGQVEPPASQAPQ